MFKKLQNSWELVKASVEVLKVDKELVLFPIMSGIGVLLVTASFIVPSLAAGFIDTARAEGGPGIAHYLVLFLFYVCQYMVIVFFNTALVGAALVRLRGGDPTFGDGFRIALSHLTNIIGYALIAATVGLLLRWLAERGMLGKVVASVLGFGWSLAVFLAVPILVTEGVSPFEAIKQSTRLLKKTWGEQIVGNFGLGIVFGVVYFLIILSGIIIIPLIASTGAVQMIFWAGGTLVILLILVTLVQSTLQGIYVAAVYHYAAEGKVGGFFREELITQAFRQK